VNTNWNENCRVLPAWVEILAAIIDVIVLKSWLTMLRHDRLVKLKKLKGGL
jgi:hypothetical protein